MGRFTKIEVDAVKLTVAPGHLIELTDEQAEKRKIFLAAEGDGVYRVLKQVEFKRGEVIGFEYAMLPKADRARVLNPEQKAEAVVKAGKTVKKPITKPMAPTNTRRRARSRRKSLERPATIRFPPTISLPVG